MRSVMSRWWSWLLLALLLAQVGCGGPPELVPLAPDARILAFGDSLTFGTGAPPEQSYPVVLSALIGREVINAGVPGELSADGLARLPELLDEEQPNLLILCHGGNDILRGQDLGATQRNIESMIALARERDIPVVLMGVPARRLFVGTAEFYAEVAEAAKVPFEGEIIAAILSDAKLKSDPVHPNAAGYRRIAEAMHRLLAKTGAVAAP